jgi:Golgi SNAP receptor complex protein 1
MATPSTGQDARSRARRLEGNLDSKLAQLSRSSSQDDRGGAGLEREIEALLQDLEQVNDQMSREAMDGPGGTATAMHKLQRHREILHDFQQEFARCRSQQRQAMERSQLLSSVRETISEHRCAASQASEALLRERNAISASGRAADEVLGQAAATRDALHAQRGGFGAMTGKLGALASLAPQVNSLINAIGRRQKRDKIILAVAFGLCTALLLWYGFG